MPRDQVFISYSHKDKKWLKRLQVVLAPLTRSGTVTVWADTEIRSGQKWRQELDGAIGAASVAVLLVSPDFLASDFIVEHELPALFAAAEKGEVTILWVAVSAVLDEKYGIEQYQAVNDPKRPLDSLGAAAANRELVEIAKKIRDAAAGGRAPAPQPAPAQPKVEPADSLRHDVTGFVGRTHRGPTKPLQVTSWAEYLRVFGPPTDLEFSALGYCVRGFFENGGREAYVVRLLGEGSTRALVELGDPAAESRITLSARDPGAWANDIRVQVRAGSRRGIRLTISYRSETEDYDNVAMEVDHPRNAVAVINEKSRLVEIVSTHGVADPPRGTFPLAGGADGVPGNSAQAIDDALSELDSFDSIGLLCVPDQSNPAYSAADREAMTRCLICYCERRCERFGILALPPGIRRADEIPPLPDTAAAGIFAPWVRVPAENGREPVPIPPVGHVAGAFAAADARSGLLTPLAGVPIAGVAAEDPLEFYLGADDLESFARRGVNALDWRPPRLKLATALTMAIDENWQDIAFRRFVQFVMASLEQGTKWVVFEAHTEATWEVLTKRISDFLETLRQRGFLGEGAKEESYFVVCDRTTNTQNDIDNGRIVALVAFFVRGHGTVSLQLVRQLETPVNPLSPNVYSPPRLPVWRIQGRNL